MKILRFYTFFSPRYAYDYDGIRTQFIEHKLYEGICKEIMKLILNGWKMDKIS
ncbi:MAG: hypothetical protein ACPL7B_13890 [Candidatus Poribacteria bacterium]